LPTRRWEFDSPYPHTKINPGFLPGLIFVCGGAIPSTPGDSKAAAGQTGLGDKKDTISRKKRGQITI